MLRVFQWRWAEAEQSCQRAISLESTNAFAHITYPLLCSFLGRHEEALLHARKGVELDPLDLMTNFRLLQANYYARRYEDAVRCGRVAIELTPDSPYTCFYLAFSLAAQDLKDESWALASNGRKLNEGLPLGEGYFGFIAGVLGHAIEARGVIGQLRARRERAYSAVLPIALTYLGLGENRLAFEWLEKALSEGDPFLGSLIVFPAYDAIRDQPEFRRLAEQLKLPT
jgi:tetratricopeptide (TPR) repeat protein